MQIETLIIIISLVGVISGVIAVLYVVANSKWRL